MADNHLMCAAKLALLTDREAAHHLIQDFSDADANWLHAVLHKIEGDEWNSRYWYERTANHNYEDFMNSTEELQAILRQCSNK